MCRLSWNLGASWNPQALCRPVMGLLLQWNKTMFLMYYWLHVSVFKTVIKPIAMFVCLFLARQPPQWARASSFTGFLNHTQRRIAVGRTPLDEWSARHRDLYLKIHTLHSQQTCIHAPVGFEPTIPAGERPQTYASYSGVPRNFVRVGVQQIQLRTERTGIWGGGSPLVRAVLEAAVIWFKKFHFI